MFNKKGGILLLSITTLLIFLSVAYLSSCTKQSTSKYSCQGVVCLNGGYCDSASCVCPVGYEGANCSIPSVQKYIGTWNAVETVTGSDSAAHRGIVTNFSAFLKNTATPTTFFICNFNGNADYNNILCTIDSIPTVPVHPYHVAVDTYTTKFVIDTFSNSFMLSDHYMLQWGSGSISSGIITATYCVKYLNKTFNRETDTVSLVLTPQ